MKTHEKKINIHFSKFPFRPPSSNFLEGTLRINKERRSLLKSLEKLRLQEWEEVSEMRLHQATPVLHAQSSSYPSPKGSYTRRQLRSDAVTGCYLMER